MVPPSPYLLRDVGDPQVTRDLRSCFFSGPLYVVSPSLGSGFDAGCISAAKISLIPSDMGDDTVPIGRMCSAPTRVQAMLP